MAKPIRDLNKYRFELITKLEDEFEIYIHKEYYTKLMQAKTVIEIDRVMRSIFDKYL